MSFRNRESHDVMRTPSARHKRRSIRSGYAFAHQEGFGRLITSGKMSMNRHNYREPTTSGGSIANDDQNQPVERQVDGDTEAPTTEPSSET